MKARNNFIKLMVFCLLIATTIAYRKHILKVIKIKETREIIFQNDSLVIMTRNKYFHKSDTLYYVRTAGSR